MTLNVVQLRDVASVRDAFILMRDLETSCKLQLQRQAAGDSFALPSKEVLDNAAKQRKAHYAGRVAADWPAWRRRLDRIYPSYGE